MLSGLKQAISSLFSEALDTYKPPTPLHMGPFTPQICTDLRRVKYPCKTGGNGGKGRKKNIAWLFREKGSLYYNREDALGGQTQHLSLTVVFYPPKASIFVSLKKGDLSVRAYCTPFQWECNIVRHPPPSVGTLITAHCTDIWWTS